MTGASADYPNLPANVGDNTPLPFAIWRVVDLMNGRRSLETIARMSALSVPQLQDVIARASRLATSSVTAVETEAATLTDPLIDTISACLIATIGPMGDLLIDEALDELGDDAVVSDFLNHLNANLQPPARAAFAQRLRTKGLA